MAFNANAYQNETRENNRKVNIPACANPKRRRECEADTKLWFETYLPKAFPKPFGPPHMVMINKSDSAIRQGGRSCVAEPRGYGKSTTFKARALKSLITGEKRYCALIGADASAAEKNLKGIIMWIMFSETMAEDYPEIYYPIKAAADGKPYPTAQRAKTLLVGKVETCGCEFDIEAKEGDPIFLDLKTSPAYIYFPWYPSAKSTGAVLFSAGITSGVRGENRHLPDGSIIRPDLVLIDDPQTKESAKSPSQTKTRKEIIEEDLAGLAGQGEEISMLCATTVIEKDDLSDQLLNRLLNPDWRGERTAMLDSFPVHMNDAKGSDINWAEYNKIRIEGLDSDDDGKMANVYYLENQAILDDGAITTWDGIKKKKHISPIQSAMELYLKDPKGFFSEYQNDPQDDEDQGQKLDRDVVLRSINGLDLNVLPDGYNIETIAIDLNDYALSWSYCGFKNDMTTVISNYGQYPDGARNVYDNDMGISREEAFTNSLTTFIKQCHDRYPLALIGIDGNFLTNTVHQVCAQMVRFGIKCFVMRGRGSKQYRPMKQNDKKLIGSNRNHCHYQKGINGNEIFFDSHYWHRQTQSSFRIKAPSPGSLSVYGKNPKDHSLLADHCTADRLLAYFIKDGKEYYDWYKPPGHDNDIFDAISMSQILANMNGCDFVLAGQKQRRVIKKRKKKTMKSFN